MSKKIKLSINEPCHENWEKMTPVEKGKFCGSCQKQVVDFSNMSDRQIAEFFKKPSTGSVCGRFMADQLDRDIQIPRKRIPWFKYFFTIALPAMFVTKAATQKIGKVAVPVTQKDTTTNPVIPTMGLISPDIRPVCNDNINTTVKGKVASIPDEKILKGRVLDENGQPLTGASIIIRNSNKGVLADSDGRFTIKVRTGDVLIVSSIGYITFETVVLNTQRLEVKMKKVEEIEVLAGMISIDYCEKPARDTVINFPIEIINHDQTTSDIDIIEANSSDAFRIFPNPVNAGQSLLIECSKLEPENHQLQWFSNTGQLVKQEKIDAAARKNFRTFVPPVRAGSYYLVLTENRSGKKFAQKIIVQ